MVLSKPEIQSALRSEVVADSIRVCAVSHTLELVQKSKTDLGVVKNGDLANAAGEGLIFHGYAYAQSLELDTEEADDVVFSKVVTPIYIAVAGIYEGTRKPANVLETNPLCQKSHRVEWNIVMNEQRTLDGDKVLSPYGIDYAEEVATGGIILPGKAPLDTDYQRRIDAIMHEHRIGVFDAITQRSI